MSAQRLPIGKECPKCGEWKLLDEFHRDSSRLDGRTINCTMCRREYYRRYYVENNEVVKERNRRYYAENKEVMKERNRLNNATYRTKNRRKLLEAKRQYREKNREKIRAYDKHYRECTKDEKKEYKRRYYKINPESFMVASHRYRARKVAARGEFTVKEFLLLCKSNNYKCLCCGERKRLTADHIVPLSRGGSNDISNIQPLCRSCNSRKGTNTTDYRPLFDEGREELGETG